LVRDYVVGEDVKWEDGALELDFQGNRVDVIPAVGLPQRGSVEVWLDDKRPSEFLGCYAHTRPSTGHGTWGPGVLRVTFQQRPLIEDWTVRVTDFDEASKIFRFAVVGSETGPDGTGVSSEDFVSDSVVIRAHVKPPGVPEQTDWRMQGVIPVGYEVRWKTIGMFQDRYQPPATADTTREHTATVAQGFPNGQHTLRLVCESESTPAIRAIRVYCPPLKE
jgi:hypothetical protein